MVSILFSEGEEHSFAHLVLDARPQPVGEAEGGSVADRPKTIGERARDLLEQMGQWLDVLIPPPPVPVPVPVPSRRRR